MLYFLLSLVFATKLALSVIIDRPESSPKRWLEDSRSIPTKKISLTFAIKNQNLDKLERVLLAVSTPGNDEYGNFRDISEMQDMIAPKVSSIKNVLKWLMETFTNEDIIHETSTSDLLTVKTTIAVAEMLLNCKYYDYTFVSDGKTHRVSRVRMGTDYNVPSVVENDLYFVSPTHRFPLFSKPKVRKLSKVTVGEQTPTTLRALYNVGSAAGVSSSNSQAIASFRLQYYDLSDVQLMWSTYGITPATITNVPTDERFVLYFHFASHSHIACFCILLKSFSLCFRFALFCTQHLFVYLYVYATASGTHIEAELDVQYITSMGQAVPTQVWWTKGINFEDAMLEWTVDMLETVANDTNPLLISVSYGGSESTFGETYVTRMNTQLALMGTAGISVLFASGDSGAGGGCTGDTDKYEPDYPACSPYVTAVGGVHDGTAGHQPLGEEAWADGGGGFSNYVSTQSWQTSAVAYYLGNEDSLPDSFKYNSSGRGFPDISAQSVEFLVYKDGESLAVSGTSCASPTAAGIFALLNDLRLQNGMSQLGFLNPFIYSTAAANSSAFNDCSSGYNNGCGDAQGFPAAAKWDPATGYGSPNYEVLADIVVETGEKTKKWTKK